MLIVVANVYVQDGKQEEFLACAKKCVDATLKEAGNISYDLNQNAFDKTRFTFVENWQSKEALDLHMNEDHFKTFGAGVTPLLAKDLEIKVYDANPLG